jgi:hypothetical protein
LLLVAAVLAGRRALGRWLISLARVTGQAWHRALGSRRPHGASAVALAPAERRPPRMTSRDLLASIRREAASVMADNGFIPLAAAGGTRSQRSLAEFADQQAQLLASDRRSYLHLAARFADTTAGTFFAELADAARHAGEVLAAVATPAGARRAGHDSREQVPGCQAYPSFVSWLALNSSAQDAALAVAVSLDLWARDFAAMARALREAPGLAEADRATAFFDIFAVAGSRIEDQAVAVAQEAQDAGREPARAREYARTLAAYQSMWWTALTDRAPSGTTLA